MKAIFLSFLFVSVVMVLAAQTPQAINYQAIARDKSGSPITNQSVGVQFRILEGGVGERSAYTETHATTTNQLGLFNLQIGRGTLVEGAFADIDWSHSPCFLEVGIDPTGGRDYVVVGSSEMLAVPYALAAACPGCTGIYDGDLDTWVEAEKNPDENIIRMSLGSDTPNPPASTEVLVLRKTVPNLHGRNTMLEILDPTGGLNTFVGEKAGGNNTFIPVTAGLHPFDVGIDNAAFGYDALGRNNIGRDNTAIGTQSLRLNTTGNFNTGTGFLSLTNNNSGNSNTGTGYRALHYNTQGNGNTAVGAEALYSNLANGGSTAIGYRAMLRADDNSIQTVARATFNTAVGYEALYGSPTPANNTGRWNTALGNQTLWLNAAGNNNTATGSEALYFNGTGNDNTAYGVRAMYQNINGSDNTAIGNYALYKNGTGAIGSFARFNTGVGSQSLYENIDGRENTASGNNALAKNDHGNYNTATGVNALSVNTTGSLNTAIGHAANVGSNNLTNATAIGANAKVTTDNAMILGDPAVNVGIGLSSDPTGPQNKLEINTASLGASGLRLRQLNSTYTAPAATSPKVLTVNAAGDVEVVNGTGAFGVGAVEWAFLGNSITPGQFLGTTNAEPLVFKVNSQRSGFIHKDGPTFLGLEAGLNNNTVTLTNTGIGFKALIANISGTDNTATGYHALTNNTGSGNTATGTFALRSNTTGISNTANGKGAMQANTTGGSNTANGISALYSNTSGSYNTANGESALYFNTTGIANTANGGYALYANTTGNANTAYGQDALHANTTGINNTAAGVNSLYSNQANSRSTAIGYGAMQFADNRTALARNTYNTAVGFEALRGSTTAVNNSGQYNTALGDQALFSNTSGSGNTATGANALANNTNGGQNTAYGANALANNTGTATTGFRNTATGASALNLNITGVRNTANGASALQNNKSNDNTATGASALLNNTGTATTGFRNTATGALALLNNVTGSSNTAIGYAADVFANTLVLSNASAIGANAKVRHTNAMILGDNSVNVGIGLSGNAAGPANKLEINANVANASGLRFRQLKSTSTPITTPTYNNVLTVDLNGDVILVPCCSTGGGGGIVGACSALPALTANAGTNLNGHNFYFQGSAVPNTNDNVGIGIPCGAPFTAKLHVQSTQNVSGNNTGIFSDVYNNSASNTGMYGAGSGGNAVENIGVRGLASGANSNYGVYGSAPNLTSTGTNFGVFGFAQSAPTNYGGYFSSTGFGPVTNYGVYATASGANNPVNNWAFYCNGKSFQTSGALWTTSDRKLKKEIVDLADASSILHRLSPKTYYFRTDEYPFIQLPVEKQYGLIADEVQKVMPEAVTDVHHPAQKDQDGNEISPGLDFRALNYNAFIPILIQGMKEQQVQIEALKLQNAQLLTLTQQNQSLQTQVDALRADLLAFRAAIEQPAAAQPGSGTK